MNKQEFLRKISGITKSTNELVNGAWVRIGESYGYENVISAIEAHFLDPDAGMFDPMPAHITRIIQGTATNLAMVAWQKVMGVIDKSSAANFVFDDPIIHMTIEAMGGWGAVCLWRIDELGFKSNEFVKQYETLSKQQIKPDYSRVMTSWGEGAKVETIPVGDRELCKLVFLGKFDQNGLIQPKNQQKITG